MSELEVLRIGEHAGEVADRGRVVPAEGSEERAHGSGLVVSGDERQTTKGAALGESALGAADAGAEEIRVWSTASVVERQLAAIGGSEFEVRVELAGESETWHWSGAEVVERVEWLEARNAAGAEVRVRPFESAGHESAVVVSGLSPESLPRLSARGYEPAAIVETGPGEFEAWLRPGGTTEEASVLRGHLAEEFGGRGESAFGRLAGFRVPTQPGDRVGGVWAQLREWSGRIASAGAELLTWARRVLAERKRAGGDEARGELEPREARQGRGWIGRGVERIRAWGTRPRRIGEGSEVSRDVASRKGAGSASGSVEAKPDRTTEAVSSQLSALGAERFEVGVFERSSGRMLNREWSRAEVMAGVPWLKSMNARGHDIFVRPARSEPERVVLVDDLDREALYRMQHHGWQPAVVVETSPSNYQAWVRVGQIGADEHRAVAQWLARELGGDPNSAAESHYGRLAGFTNRKPSHERADGLYPFVLLREAGGSLPRQRAELVSRATAVRAEPAMQASGGAAARAGLRRAAGGREEDALQAFVRESEQLRRAAPARRGGAVDQSWVDVVAAQNLAIRGYDRGEIEGAMRAGSPDLETRKKGHVDDYIRLQVDWALQSNRVVAGRARVEESVRRAQRIARTGSGPFEEALPLFRSYVRQASAEGLSEEPADQRAATALRTQHRLPPSQIEAAIRGGSPVAARLDSRAAQDYAQRLTRQAMQDSERTAAVQRERSSPGRPRSEERER